jgi:hypothetical protein
MRGLGATASGPDIGGRGAVGAAALGDDDREGGIDVAHQRAFAGLVAGIDAFIGGAGGADLLALGLAFAAAQDRKNVESRSHRPTPSL